MWKLSLLFFSIITVSCLEKNNEILINYPKIETEIVQENYFNVLVNDSYRNLENLKDSAVVSWFAKQENLSDSIIQRLNNKDKIYDNILALEKKKTNIIDKYYITKDESYFFLKRKRDEQISKLYFKKDLNSQEELILNPKDYKENYTINYFKLSPDLSKVAISLAKRGEESSEVIIYDFSERKIMPQTIKSLSPDLVGGINWLPDSSGFIYLSIPHFDYDLSSYLLNTRSFVYKLGEMPSQAIEIFSKSNNPSIKLIDADFPIAQTREENPDLLFGRISGNSDFKDVYFVKNPDWSFSNNKLDWRPLFKQTHKIEQYIIVNDSIIYRTALNASNYKICKTSLEEPNYENPQVLVSEKSDRVIVDFEYIDEIIYYTTLKNGVHANFFTMSKVGEKEITLPFPSGISYLKKRGKKLYIGSGGWTRPYSLFKYIPGINHFEPADIDTTSYPEFESLKVEEIEVPSHDGVMVPLSIIYKSNLIRDGSNRVFIMAYGSYAFSRSPFFYFPNLSWIDQGGILAVAHVRGGGEKGDAWHKGGYKTTKHNTWKDLIKCTEYLINENYSSPQNMIAYGVSAGGIAVGRAVTERPDLYAVGLLDVPFLNTIRIDYQPFGADSIKEFGTTKDSLEFRALLEMDSYHSIKKGIEYPAMYVSTAMNDGLVTPWDPGKFVAKMQNYSETKKPVLFSVDMNSGHGGDGTYYKFYRDMANMFTFALWQTGHPNYQLKNDK